MIWTLIPLCNVMNVFTQVYCASKYIISKFAWKIELNLADLSENLHITCKVIEALVEESSSLVFEQEAFI